MSIKQFNSACHACGKSLAALSTSRLWCSMECVNTFRTARRNANLDLIYRESATCLTCGATFVMPARGNKVYCAIKCRRKADRQLAIARLAGTPLGLRPCAGCGCEYLPNRRGAVQKYCTVECRTRVLAARDTRRRGGAIPTARDCLTCGTTFIPGCDSVKGKRVVVCSQSCHGRVDVGVRRARKWTDQVERIYPMVVMQRDDWTCQICGDAIDPHATFPSSRYRSIDHVVPLTHGGSHLYANVQAAHFGCNVAKGKEQAESYMTG